MANYFSKSKHGLSITDPSTADVIGFCIDRVEGKLSYAEYDGKAYVDLFSTSPTQISTNPEEELVLGQSSFRAGMGMEYFDSDHPERYFSSIGMDLRFKNMAVCGSTPNGISLPSITTCGAITNANMETEATGWTGGVWDATHKLSGAKGWVVNNATAYQDLTWNTNHKGHTYEFRCWVYASAVDRVRISINDTDASVTYSAYSQTAAGWEQLSVQHTVSSSGTRLRISMHATTANNEWFDDAEIIEPVAGKCYCLGEYADDLYFGIGNELYKLNDAGTGFTSVAIFKYIIESISHFADGFLYISQSSFTVIENCEDAWDESGDAAVTSTTDTGDYKVGSASAKLIIGAGVALNTLFATEVISATNISSADGVVLWIKSSIAMSAGDLELHMGATANCASPTEEIALPALTAGKWTRIFLPLATKSTDTAIISIGLYQTADKGACTIWLDDVRAYSNYCYINSASVVTRSSLSAAERFCTVHKASPTLYKKLAPNNVYASTDPTNAGSWGTVITIGSAQHEITDLIEWNGTVYIMKESIPYYIDSNDAADGTLAPELRTEESTTSGKNAVIYHNKLYIPAGDQALLETDGTTNTFISPANYCTNLSSFVGRVQALACDTFNLFAIVDNDTKVEVLAGRNETIGTTTSWVWHPIAEITLAGAEVACVSTVYKKRLWIASTSSSDKIYYLSLYTSYGDITNDSNADFNTGTEFITPWLHGDFKSTTKAWVELTVTMGHTYDSAIYFTVKYQKLGDSAWTTIGNFTGSSTTMVHSEYIPVDGSSYYPVSTMMRFQFIAVTDTTAKTPVLLNYAVKALLYPESKKIIHARVRVKRDSVGLGGLTSGQMYEKQKTCIANCKDATWAVTIKEYVTDKHGVTYYVKFLPLPQSIKAMEVTHKEPEKDGELEYDLLMLVIPLSASAGTAPTWGGHEVVRTATIVIAASNASSASVVQCDELCDGTSDESEINTAIGELA